MAAPAPQAPRNAPLSLSLRAKRACSDGFRVAQPILRDSGEPWLVNARPDLALGRVEDAGRDDQKQDHLEADAVPIVQIGLGRPAQKTYDVGRHLRHGGLR